VSGPSRDPQPAGSAAVRYRLEVRLSAADVGSRVVIRWRRPAGDSEQIADVLGVLTAADGASFTVRKAFGELVAIPHDRVLAGKTVPPRRAAPRKQEPGTGELPRGRPGKEALPASGRRGPRAREPGR
jgi:hypothetical protein